MARRRIIYSGPVSIGVAADRRPPTADHRRRIARLVGLAILGVAGSAGARDVAISEVEGLRAAIAAAAPGDVLLLAPGSYEIDRTLDCTRAGQATAPIVVRSSTPLGAVLRVSVQEGFRVQAAYWRFEGLEVIGTCASDDVCEHAFHLSGDADGVVLRGNRLRNFNAQVKSNGDPTGVGGRYPDDVVIEGNELYDDAARRTSNPVTKVDVVGGRRWVVRANYLHDFEKAGGDGISYGAFLKGHSAAGLFERNLVSCETRGARTGTRVGLSLGGGGSAPDTICEQGSCSPEHDGGTLRNNLILRCSDVGIYINKGAGSRILANTLYLTTGIDVRFSETSAEVRSNVTDGRIRTRDGAGLVTGLNLEDVTDGYLEGAFRAPQNGDFFPVGDLSMMLDRGEALADVTEDYCGHPRTSATNHVPDLGALELLPGPVCDTRRPPLAGGAGAGGAGAGGNPGPGDGGAAGAPDASPPMGNFPGGSGTLPVDEKRGGCSVTGAASGVPWCLTALALLRRRRR